MKQGFAKILAPLAALVIAIGSSSCIGATLDSGEGKPISELDLSGPLPQDLVLLGPDEVRVSTGDKLAISVDGDPETKERLRFKLEDGVLTIKRKSETNSGSNKGAVVNVTMPALREVKSAGSGKISAATLANEAKIIISGAGEVETPRVSSDLLELSIVGAGNYLSAGHVKKLNMKITGNGAALMDSLKVDDADVIILGSGNASFASDGEVQATITGPGNVHVKGRATCRVDAKGPGKLVCENAG